MARFSFSTALKTTFTTVQEAINAELRVYVGLTHVYSYYNGAR